MLNSGQQKSRAGQLKMVRKIFILFLICYLAGAVTPPPSDISYLFEPIFVKTCNAQEPEIQSEPNKEPDKPKDECINIKSLVLRGNISFSDWRLKMRMKSWHSSLLPGNFNCYNEEWLKKDILKLIEFYRKKGFPDVDIDYILSKKNEGKATVEVVIEEGLIYGFIFNGNRYFSDRELKKKIDLVKKGNPDDSGLSRAKADIKNIYLEAGFQDVTVEFHKTKVEPQTSDSSHEKKLDRQTSGTVTTIWQIEFVINEGQRMVVNKLKIQGNKKVAEDEIMAAMVTRQKGTLQKGGYSSKILDKDINAVEILYLSKGFLNAVISKKTTINNLSPSKLVDIEIDINEGVQTLVKSTRITGLEGALSLEEALAKCSLAPGKPFREYMVKSDENAIGMMVSELGYPHVKVHSSVTLNSDKSEADVVWNVEKGLFTRFGKINYSGNSRLKSDVIEKRMEVKPGEPFSLKKIFLAEKSIRESSAVKYVQVKSPGLAKMEPSPDIEVNIEENKPYFVEAAVGYDTEKNLYIDSKVGDNNFLGEEIDGWISASISGIGYRGETGIKKPFLLGTEIDGTSNIYIEDKAELNKNFGTRSWGYSSGISRKIFTKNLLAGLNLTYENRTTYGDIEAAESEEQKARNILITSFTLGYDSRDSSVRPSRGIFSSGSLDLYAGFNNDLDRFLKYQIDIRKYTSPFNKITFALRTRMGYIHPLGSENIVAKDQLFFLGGTPNVRGFDENMLEYDANGDPAGGNTSVNSTLEARIDLPADFELNFFADTGKVDDLANHMESGGFRSSVGAGLRYVTPIGPVGLLYGHKLDTEDGESPGRVHFSVGYTF